MKWLDKIIDKRIAEHKKGGASMMQYNPLLVELHDTHNDKHLTRRILENSVWYSGIETDIQYFYTKEAPKFHRKGQQESLNYFWAKVDTNFRKIHSGFPQLISEKMVDLLISNGYNIVVEGDDEVGLQEKLDEILTDNKFKSMVLAKAIETESWSGGTSLKLSWNPTLSDYPIIEVWEPENYTNTVVSGRIMEDIFFIYYDKGNRKFRLSEIYGVDSKGSYIDYKLEELMFSTSEGEWKLASLKELEQTRDLKRISFDGYYKRLSMYKANKLPNSEFRYSVIGESDYAGSYGAFDAIDEIISTWIQEFRDGKLYRYFPEELMIKGTDGKYVYPDGFVKEHILFADSPSENVEKQKISYHQGDVRVEKHLESYKVWAMHLLNNAGLSPLTVGATGLESTAASDQSQQEREKVSIRTRNKKAEMWTEFLQEFLKITLEFYLINTGVTSLPEFDIKVSFNDYIIKSKADRTEEVRNGLGTSWDILSGVRYVHDNMTAREQYAMSARIKLENNYNSISQAEMSALQADNLADNEVLEDEDVEIIEVEQETEAEPEVDVDNATPETTPEATPEQSTVEDTLLNGAQIQSAVSIVDNYNNGVLSFEAALEMLMTFLKIPEEKARKMLTENKKKKPEAVTPDAPESA